MTLYSCIKFMKIFLCWKLRKDVNSVKIYVNLWLLLFANHVRMFYICIKFLEINLNGFRSRMGTHFVMDRQKREC